MTKQNSSIDSISCSLVPDTPIKIDQRSLWCAAKALNCLSFVLKSRKFVCCIQLIRPLGACLTR